jgi:hypothetical protein
VITKGGPSRIIDREAYVRNMKKTGDEDSRCREIKFNAKHLSSNRRAER